jgi:hypothetical protein
MQEDTQVVLRVGVPGVGGFAPHVLGGGMFTAIVQGHSALI